MALFQSQNPKCHLGIRPARPWSGLDGAGEFAARFGTAKRSSESSRLRFPSTAGIVARKSELCPEFYFVIQVSPKKPVLCGWPILPDYNRVQPAKKISVGNGRNRGNGRGEMPEKRCGVDFGPVARSKGPKAVRNFLFAIVCIKQT